MNNKYDDDDELKVVYLEVSEDFDGSLMKTNSMVSKPATKKAYNKFSSDEISDRIFTTSDSGIKEISLVGKNSVGNYNKESFSFDDYKRVVTGPIMLSETNILRKSPDLGLYNCRFSEESIFNMMVKYFKMGFSNNMDEEHNSNRKVDDIYMIESFIVGDRVSSNLYPELNKGSWIGSYFIEDEDYWNDYIMTDKFTGFSLDGCFIENWEQEIIESMYKEVEYILNSNKSDKFKEFNVRKILNNLI